MTPSILFISLLFLGISMLVSGILKSRFSKYSKLPLSAGLSGAEVAAKMLRDNGIYDVKITSVNGFMTDHYNPANKTINLSPDVTMVLPWQLRQLPPTNAATRYNMPLLINGLH
jgi:hypothetical protein